MGLWYCKQTKNQSTKKGRISEIMGTTLQALFKPNLVSLFFNPKLKSKKSWLWKPLIPGEKFPKKSIIKKPGGSNLVGAGAFPVDILNGFGANCSL